MCFSQPKIPTPKPPAPPPPPPTQAAMAVQPKPSQVADTGSSYTSKKRGKAALTIPLGGMGGGAGLGY